MLLSEPEKLTDRAMRVCPTVLTLYIADFDKVNVGYNFLVEMVHK
jgi:hypothetical protein